MIYEAQIFIYDGELGNALRRELLRVANFCEYGMAK